MTAALAALSCAAMAAASTPEKLEPVPRPATDALAPADRQQLQQARHEVDRLRREDAGFDDLAEAYGRLGGLYLLYDFADAARAALENARTLEPEDFSWHYYLGVLHRRQGRLEAACQSFRRALELRPDDLATQVRLGRALLDAGRPEEAVPHFQNALGIDPDSAAAHAGLGHAAAVQEDPSLAIRHLSRAVELQPAATALHHQLGLAHRRLGDMEKARKHLAQNTYQPVVFPDPLMDHLTLQLKSARAFLKRGNQALTENRIDAALEHYRRGVEIDPRDPLLRYNLATALAEAGRRRQSIVQLRTAVDLDPGYRDAHYNLAVALGRDGDHDAAAHHFEQAYRIDPGDHDSHLDWALALVAAKQQQRAIEELRSVVSAAASERPAVAARAAAQLGALAAAEGEGEEAVAHFRRAVELDPRLPEARLGLARSLARRGSLREAAKVFVRTVELMPADPEPRFGAAMALMMAGDDAEALETLEAGLDALPGDPALTHALARLLAASPDAGVRDGQRALKLARELFRRRPSLDHAEAVAMAYAETGDFENAVTWQRQVVDRARRSGRAEVAEAAQRRLDLYESARPARAPWREGRE